MPVDGDTTWYLSGGIVLGGPFYDVSSYFSRSCFEHLSSLEAVSSTSLVYCYREEFRGATRLPPRGV